MKQSTLLLLDAQASLAAALERLTSAIRTDPEAAALGDEELAILAHTTHLSRSLKPRSRADVLRWVHAAIQGDEAWLVAQSRAGDGVECRYYTRLPALARKALD